jgi:hypothetical protein
LVDGDARSSASAACGRDVDRGSIGVPKAVQGRGVSMAEDSLWPEGEYGSRPPGVSSHRPDRVDAAVDRPQAPIGHAAMHSGLANTRRPQLASGDHAVLATRKGGDRPISGRHPRHRPRPRPPPRRGVSHVCCPYDHERSSPPEDRADPRTCGARDVPKRWRHANAHPCAAIAVSGPRRAVAGDRLLQEALVVAHHQLRLELFHGVEGDADHDQDRRAAEEEVGRRLVDQDRRQRSDRA